MCSQLCSMTWFRLHAVRRPESVWISEELVQQMLTWKMKGGLLHTLAFKKLNKTFFVEPYWIKKEHRETYSFGLHCRHKKQKRMSPNGCRRPSDQSPDPVSTYPRCAEAKRIWRLDKPELRRVLYIKVESQSTTCILRSVSFCCALVWHEHTVSGHMNWEKVTVASFSEGQSDFARWNRFSSKDGKEMTKEAKLASWEATWPKLQLGSLQPTPHQTNLMVQACVISPCFRNPRDTVTPVIVA